MATEQPVIDEFEPLLSQTSSNKKKVWYKTASAWWILPSYALISITSGLGLTTRIQFYLRAVCYDYYSRKGQSLSIPFLLNPINDYPDEWCNNADVQAVTSRFIMVLNLCSAIPAVFVLAQLGSYSDIKGRKICLLIAIIGSIMTTLCVLLVGNYLDKLGIYFLLIGSLLEGITGGFFSLITVCYAYLTDCTPPAGRSVVFGWMQGALFAGLIGPMIGGWLIEMTNDLLSVFYVMLVVYVIMFLFFLFVLPESLTKEKLLDNLNRRRELNSSFNRDRSLKSRLIYGGLKPLMIFFQTKNNDDNNNNNNTFSTKYSLLLLAMINTLISGAMMGLQAIFLLYVTLVFKWNLVEQGYYLLAAGFSRALVTSVLFPMLISNIKKRIILNDLKNNDDQIFVDNDGNISNDEKHEKQLRKYEVRILRIALLFDALCYAVLGLVTTSPWFIAITMIASIGSIATSIVKSLQTSLVAPSQIGQLLGALSVLDSITRIISPVIFNSLYSILVVTSPNLIWCGVAFLLTVACFFSFCVVPNKYN